MRVAGTGFQAGWAGTDLSGRRPYVGLIGARQGGQRQTAFHGQAYRRCRMAGPHKSLDLWPATGYCLPPYACAFDFMPQACYHYLLRMTEQTSTAARKPAPLPQLDGVLVLNKPSGPTSARCLSALKRLGQRKIGHAGTLDPMATGVLLVLLGQGTKIASHLLADGGKVYSGQLRLGLTTDTWDIQGEVLTESPWQQVTEADVRAEVAHWLILHEQEVPAYSAAKHEGQSLYKLARKGKEVPKKVKSMEISQADVLEVELPFVRFRVACSSGTYIRSLAHSLGMRLGCGAVLTELTREYSHPFGLEVACGLDELSADPGLLVKHLRPLAEALPHWPVLELDEAAEARIRNGMAIPCRDDVGDKALLQRQGMPLALARRSETPQGPCWTVLRGLWN